MLGFKFNVTVESIHKGQDGPFDVMIVNCTVIHVGPPPDYKYTDLNNSFYMTVNKSENHLRYSFYVESDITFLMILPLNRQSTGPFMKSTPSKGIGTPVVTKDPIWATSRAPKKAISRFRPWTNFKICVLKWFSCSRALASTLKHSIMK